MSSFRKNIALSFVRKKGILTSNVSISFVELLKFFPPFPMHFSRWNIDHKYEDDFTFYLWYLIGRNATRTADIDRRTRLSDWFVSFPQRKDPPWWNNLTSKRKGKRGKRWVKKKRDGKGNGESALSRTVVKRTVRITRERLWQTRVD